MGGFGSLFACHGTSLCCGLWCSDLQPFSLEKQEEFSPPQGAALRSTHWAEGYFYCGSGNLTNEVITKYIVEHNIFIRISEEAVPDQPKPKAAQLPKFPGRGFFKIVPCPGIEALLARIRPRWQGKSLIHADYLFERSKFSVLPNIEIASRRSFRGT
jgi:hypothetical protein